jgi:hypothetical protein
MDYADPDQREMKAERFMLDRMDKNGQSAGCLIVTDDEIVIHSAMLLISLREEVHDWQEALGGERDGLDGLCAQIDALLTPTKGE